MFHMQPMEDTIHLLVLPWIPFFLTPALPLLLTSITTNYAGERPNRSQQDQLNCLSVVLTRESVAEQLK